MRGGHKYLLAHSLTRAVFVPWCQDSGLCPHYVIRVMVSWRHGVMVGGAPTYNAVHGPDEVIIVVGPIVDVLAVERPGFLGLAGAGGDKSLKDPICCPVALLPCVTDLSGGACICASVKPYTARSFLYFSTLWLLSHFLQ